MKLKCPDIPIDYMLPSTNLRKGYKALGSKMSHTDGQATCKADKGWLAMPKSSDDIADISQICKILKFIISHES